MLRWLARNGVQPWIRGEFDDTGLMKAFGHAGAGFLFAPEVMADEICAQYSLERIGSTKEVRQEVFAISIERRISHPAVRAITEHARGGLGPRARRGGQ
jgi:LysR family transcriptional activator of nhaA